MLSPDGINRNQVPLIDVIPKVPALISPFLLRDSWLKRFCNSPQAPAPKAFSTVRRSKILLNAHELTSAAAMEHLRSERRHARDDAPPDLRDGEASYSPARCSSQCQSPVYDEDGYRSSWTSTCSDGEAQEEVEMQQYGGTIRIEIQISCNSHKGTELACKQPAWPPSGLSGDDEIRWSIARSHFMEGAPQFNGELIHLPYRPQDFRGYFVAPDAAAQVQPDMEIPDDSAVPLLDRLPRHEYKPWWTLEYPSMVGAKGTEPGTISMNHWAALSLDAGDEAVGVSSSIEARPLSHFEICKRFEILKEKRIVFDNVGNDSASHYELYFVSLTKPVGQDSKHSLRRSP